MRIQTKVIYMTLAYAGLCLDKDLDKVADTAEILKVEDDAVYGCLFEIDLNYPREQHATTTGFPLAPESVYMEEDMALSFMKHSIRVLRVAVLINANPIENF